jgi:hypothetical protein
MKQEYDPMERIKETIKYFLISFPIIAVIVIVIKYGEGIWRWIQSLF